MTTRARTRDVHTIHKVLRDLAPQDVGVDHTYQRPLDEDRALVLGVEFNSELFGLPVVSLREDGTLWWLDGQHRGVGLCLAGRGDMKVTVDLRTGLTVKEEARVFYDLNTGSTRIQAIENYKARKVWGHEVILEIERILRKTGLKVASGNTKRSVSAVSALEQIHVSKQNLLPTLQVLRAWSDVTNDDSTTYESQMMRYMSLFLFRFPTADLEVLAAKLDVFGKAQKFLAKVKLESKSFHMTRPETAVNNLLGVYNYRNRRKLTPADLFVPPPKKKK